MAIIEDNLCSVFQEDCKTWWICTKVVLKLTTNSESLTNWRLYLESITLCHFWSLPYDGRVCIYSHNVNTRKRTSGVVSRHLPSDECGKNVLMEPTVSSGESDQCTHIIQPSLFYKGQTEVQNSGRITSPRSHDWRNPVKVTYIWLTVLRAWSTVLCQARTVLWVSNMLPVQHSPISTIALPSLWYPITIIKGVIWQWSQETSHLRPDTLSELALPLG